MDCRTLDINVASDMLGEGLELSKVFSKTRVVVSIVGDSLISRQETTACVQRKQPNLVLSDENILPRRFHVTTKSFDCCVSNLVHPNIIMSLLDNWTKDKQTKECLYQVVTPSGKQRGCLVFRHNVGDDENLIRTYSTCSWQLLQSRPPSRQHHGECLGLGAPKSPPCNPAYYRPPPSAPPYMDIDLVWLNL